LAHIYTYILIAEMRNAGRVRSIRLAVTLGRRHPPPPQGGGAAAGGSVRDYRARRRAPSTIYTI